MGTFKLVQEGEISERSSIVQSRFDLTIRNKNELLELFQAILVVLGPVDQDKPNFVNEAPTVT